MLFLYIVLCFLIRISFCFRYVWVLLHKTFHQHRVAECLVAGGIASFPCQSVTLLLETFETESGIQIAGEMPLSRKIHGIKFSPFPKHLADPVAGELAGQSGGEYVSGQFTQRAVHMHLLLG